MLDIEKVLLQQVSDPCFFVALVFAMPLPPTCRPLCARTPRSSPSSLHVAAKRFAYSRDKVKGPNQLPCADSGDLRGVGVLVLCWCLALKIICLVTLILLLMHFGQLVLEEHN